MTLSVIDTVCRFEDFAKRTDERDKKQDDRDAEERVAGEIRVAVVVPVRPYRLRTVPGDRCGPLEHRPCENEEGDECNAADSRHAPRFVEYIPDRLHAEPTPGNRYNEGSLIIRKP